MKYIRHYQIDVTLDNPIMLSNLTPEAIRYIDKRIGDYPTNFGYEEEFNEFITIRHYYHPNYYLNELNTYLAEKLNCPNVTEEYAEERDFRIWFYKEMYSLARNNWKGGGR